MRAKDLNDILAECLEAIENGERTAAECVALYPEHRDELSALLNTFTAVKGRTHYLPRPSFRLSSRARLMRRLAPRKAQRPRPTFFKRLLPIGMTLTMLMVSVLGVGTVYASRDALPGDRLYPVKLSIEDARLFLADDIEDITLASIFAQTRLDEIRALIDADRPADLITAVNLFTEQLESASDSLEAVSQTDPELANRLGLQLEQGFAQHTEQLTQLIESAPEKAKPALEHALLASNHGQGVIQQLREGNNPGGGPPEGVLPSDADHPGGGPPDEKPNPADPPGGGKPDKTPGPPDSHPGGNNPPNNNNNNNNRP